MQKQVLLLNTAELLNMVGRVDFFASVRPAYCTEFLACDVREWKGTKVPYFQCENTTKTYEYILSGLLCLATATKSNEDIINEDNGCLVEDNAESFAKGLEVLMGRIETINRENIKDSLSGAEWSEIVNKKLKPIIENVYEGRSFV